MKIQDRVTVTWENGDADTGSVQSVRSYASGRRAVVVLFDDGDEMELESVGGDSWNDVNATFSPVTITAV